MNVMYLAAVKHFGIWHERYVLNNGETFGIAHEHSVVYPMVVKLFGIWHEHNVLYGAANYAMYLGVVIYYKLPGGFF